MTEREELEDALEKLQQHAQRIDELRHEIAHTKSQLAALMLQVKGEAPSPEPWHGSPNSLGAKNGTISDLNTQK
jgi:hypothetical protein